MAFPESNLDIAVELQIDGAWTDISTDVRYEQGIKISTGRTDEGTEVEPSTCSLTVDNRDGKYSPRLATGPYFGKIGRNTPIRVSVDEGDTYLSIADVTDDRASTPDHASLDITGDLDVRVEARLDNWFDSDAQALVGKYSTTGNQRSFRLETQNGSMFLGWSTTGSDILQRQSTQVLTVPPSRRFAVRATLDVNDGSGNHVVTFYTAPTLDGPWTVLGDPVVTAGTTSVFASTAPLDVGDIQTLSADAPVGEILAAEVRNGIAGTAVANPDFTAQVSGGTSFVDAAGRTWTLAGNASLTNRRVRFVGEVSEWPPRWDTGGFDVVDNLQAAGLLRRLEQAGTPLQSTLRRRIPSGDPLAYWPMEDGEGTTRPASPIAGVKPLTVSNLEFGADETLDGSGALPTLGATSKLSGSIPGATAGGWHLEFVYNIPVLWTTERPVMTLHLAGSGSSVAAVHVRAWTGGIRVQALDGDDAVVATNLTTDAQAIADFAADWSRLQIFSYDDGPDTHVVAAWRRIDNDTFWFVSTSFTGAPGKAVRCGANWHADLEGMSFGHLSVFDTGGTSTTSPGVTIYAGADDGFAGETALNRMDRIVEEGASDGTSLFLFDGDQTTGSEQLGGQGVASYLEVLRDAASVDGGILYERRDRSTALAYRDRASLYNQPHRFTLDYQGADGLVTPLEPTEDDQGVTNDRTVNRRGGSFGRVVLEEGALSVQVPPNGIGRAATEIELNMYRDERTEDVAGWQMHLATVDEARYPTVTVDLANAPASVTDASEVVIGDRIKITNPPAWLPPDDIDLIVQGYNEDIDQRKWTITYNCTPAAPWTVGVRENEVLGKRDTAGSELAGAVGSTETSIPVTVTEGPLWVAGSISYTGETATASATSATPDYLVCTDADATDITVGDDVRIFTATGDLKEATIFEITGKTSAFGFTNCEFTPDAAALTETDDQLRVVTFTGEGAEFPFDIRTGGEVMTVSSIANTNPITDAFGRTEASTWGTSDSGHAWSSTGGSAANFSVSSGKGRHSLTTVNVSRYSVATADSADFDISITVETDALATGASQRAYLLGRYTATNNNYGARLDFNTNQTIDITLFKLVAGVSTVWTTVSTGLTHVANTQYRVRFQIVGSELKAKAWLASGTEPDTWQTTRTDTSLTTAGSVGVRTLLNTGNTNTLPVGIAFDDFASPQVFGVERSVNTVVKSQTDGTDLRLQQPAVRAL